MVNFINVSFLIEFFNSNNLQNSSNKVKVSQTVSKPQHIEYKMTASKLAGQRMKTSNIMSSKNSQCLSLHSYEDSVDMTNPQAATNGLGQGIAEDLLITTIDKQRSLLPGQSKPLHEDIQRATQKLQAKYDIIPEAVLDLSPIGLGNKTQLSPSKTPQEGFLNSSLGVKNTLVNSALVSHRGITGGASSSILSQANNLFKKNPNFAHNTSSGQNTSRQLYSHDAYFYSTTQKAIGTNKNQSVVTATTKSSVAPVQANLGSPKNATQVKRNNYTRNGSGVPEATYSNQYTVAEMSSSNPSPYYQQQKPTVSMSPSKKYSAPNTKRGGNNMKQGSNQITNFGYFDQRSDK